MSLSRANPKQRSGISVLIMCDAVDRLEACTPTAPLPLPRPKTGSASSKLQSRVWNLLRIRPKASLQELVEVLTDADQSSHEKNSARTALQKFIRTLQQAGYLTEVRPGTRSNSFVLTRNTGPLAPVVQARHHSVYDQNEKKHYAIQK